MSPDAPLRFQRRFEVECVGSRALEHQASSGSDQSRSPGRALRRSMAAAPGSPASRPGKGAREEQRSDQGSFRVQPFRQTSCPRSRHHHSS